MQFKNTIQSLQKLGGSVIKEGRGILKKKKKQTRSNTLYNDFDYLVTNTKDTVTLEFEFGRADDYWAFVDEGVRGAGGYKGSGRMRGQGSPFKFSSKMPPRQPLINWIKNKPLKGRDKKGRFISNESFGFLIQRAIYQRGLERTQFFTRPFTTQLKKQEKKIVQAFADDLEVLLEKTLKD
ncbi:MAG: hypothetical protein Unbinned585contig1001_39 [Prokaryotic dsDNA virus sp.]|nr:MAG: hypothetical protein Unbinned585contig1001_39 [Prokaryotic dsDNA virus sp.]|tara:strand:+ start:1413 stop:1952 length:540 start_codon:yes stop_codon:yes gene_type:complete